jgi:glycosyltransferase involved in cell wall biosynthesis
MSHSPLVSIVLPVFNGEKYISEAIESVLEQSFKDFEFIIINDGSTDTTPRILDKMCSRDYRVRVLSGPNVGYALALNKGVACASGLFIARMDSDDICLPERLERQVTYLQANADCVVVGSSLLLIDFEGATVGVRKYPIKHDDIDAAHIGGLGAHLAHPATMFRKTYFDKVGGYRPKFEPAEDLDLWLRLAEVGKLANVPDVLLKYRLHAQSATSTRSYQMHANTRIITLESCLRRGVVPPPKQNLEVPHESGSTIFALSYSRSLALSAWENGYYTTARKHSLIQFKLKPASLVSWKCIFKCGLGSLTKPLFRLILAGRLFLKGNRLTGMALM